METAIANPAGGYVSRPAPSGLVDVINVILDKGLVIDLFVRVSLVGIELITIDARIVVASVDTYLRFAEAVDRLSLGESGKKPGLPELVEGVGRAASGKMRSPARALKKPLRAAKRLPVEAASAVSGAKRLPAVTAAKRVTAPSGPSRGKARKGIFKRGKPS